MRIFGPPASPELQQLVREAAHQLFVDAPARRAVLGKDFAMDEAELVVLHEVDLRWGAGQRLRIAETQAAARPPFEWLSEITADIGETDYFKHYLIRDHDIVLAQRKVLTPIDEVEARIILADLAEASSSLHQ
ncbi:MAG TPA: hypothetical protein VLI05_05255 [Candidatus Saccharimonadia bacterium]|nr:hypothetical protein [Candidatus Saccharimonadia bacterium]